MRRWLCGFILLLALLPVLAAAQDIPPQVQKALDDLNTRMGLNLSIKDVTWDLHQNVYNDASMGCPQPGFTYYKGKTIGYSVQIDVQGVTWEYRVSPDLHVTLCNQPIPLPSMTARPNTNATREYPTLGPSFNPVICKDAPVSRLSRDMEARVLPTEPGVIIHMYKIAGGEEVVNELQPGRTIKVLDGALCLGGTIWWEIVEMEHFSQGWIAENEGKRYLFEPITGSGSMLATPNAAPTIPFYLLSTSIYPTSQPKRPTSTYPSNMAPTPAPTQPAYSSNMGPSPTPTAQRAFPTNAMPPDSACTPHLPARLIVGADGSVISNLPVSLVEDVGGGKVIGQIPPGVKFRVLEGPTCASGVAWWKVQVYYNGHVGWVAETAGGSYQVMVA